MQRAPKSEWNLSQNPVRPERDHQGWWKCRFCRSKNLLSAAGAKSKGAKHMMSMCFDFAGPELAEGLNTNGWIILRTILVRAKE